MVATVVTVVVVVAGVAVLFARGRTLEGLRAEASRSSARAGGAGPAAETPARARAVAPAAVTGGAAAEVPLDAEERIELMRLRSRVSDLRDRQRALAGLSNRYVTLQGRYLAVSNYAAGKMPAGFRRRAETQNRGTGTPESSLETFLWGLEHRNLEAVMQVVPTDERKGLEEMVAQRGAEEFFRNAPAFPGFLVRSRRENGPDEVVLEVEVSAQGQPWRVTMVREAGSWRMR